MARAMIAWPSERALRSNSANVGPPSMIMPAKMSAAEASVATDAVELPSGISLCLDFRKRPRTSRRCDPEQAPAHNDW